MIHLIPYDRKLTKETYDTEVIEEKLTKKLRLDRIDPDLLPLLKRGGELFVYVCGYHDEICNERVLFGGLDKSEQSDHYYNMLEEI
jgi:hypothetical protein